LFIALLGMYIWFMIGIERTESEALCTIMSLIIQYFSLASIFWMGAEAVLMFKKLVIVFGEISLTFVIVVSLICWCKLQLHYCYTKVKAIVVLDGKIGEIANSLIALVAAIKNLRLTPEYALVSSFA